MNRLVVTLTMCWSLLNAAAAAPSSIQRDLVNPPLGRLLTRVQSLPTWLQSALARTFVQRTLDLGNPDEPLAEELHIAGQPEFPARRLVFAFESRSYYTVYVEYGAPTIHASVLVFDKPKAKGKPVHLVWGAVDLHRPFAKDRTALIARITSGALFERPGIIW